MKRRNGAFHLALFLLALAVALSAALAEEGAAPSVPAVREAVAPVFPEIARRARVVGPVKIEVTIASGGQVAEARVLQRVHERLSWVEDAALVAARQWLFEPPPSPEARHALLSFDFQLFFLGSEEEVRPQELTPVFKPPYTVLVRSYLLLR